MTSIFPSEPGYDEVDCRRSRRTRRLKRKLKSNSDEELNIVSMIDVFAVMVFFLLVGSSISASKLHTLNLTIPVASNSPAESDDDFHLAVSLYADKVVVSQEGEENSIKFVNGQVDATALLDSLKEIKAQHPEEERVSLLVEDKVSYEQIIRVMDVLRMPVSSSDASAETALFPGISMGDAAVDLNTD
ncbi:Uncharacterised protein [Zhongshania aliphaticivorans]|uniref:Biopolymer transporter ExbD n=1 Tax=Zhongshania aliphaticivorans TaxID=1470434 RepID=A0A5S9Q629_9GAMM|nr:biopolymer transporter ExbD [Zhongshania aliphaticivorans]CAA0094773.1 Uncharacterised protein [Zhongshania aliphaticivorans]CAA0112678.1 Uncharacterised protein [Zhongshania aliphaticivorans]